MPAAVSLVLLLVWLALAYRSYQRGDLLLAGIFLLVGVVITVHRLRSMSAKASGSPSLKS
ncbi:MAG TPA: hypothetical protein VED45_07665 [Steroidobacteraceae bacterium]|nr:hypothetical protein [Steroidobacteraceae bacterium]